MRSVSAFSRFVGAVALSLGIGLFGSTGALAHPVGELTIHKAECPAGVGSAIFEECHDNGLGGVGFTIVIGDYEETFVTDDDGVIGPIVLPAAEDIVIVEDPDVAEDYLGIYVYCSNVDTGEVIFDGDLDGYNGIVIAIASHESGSTVCDWYNITPAGTDGVTTLPSTGTGVNAPVNSGLPLYAAFGGMLLLAVVTLRKRNA